MQQAIVSVSSDDFYEGTFALLQSFKQENEWFEGDFVVIDAGLKREYARELQEVFDCKIIHIDTQLKENIEELVNLLPQYATSYKRFYSLQAFHLHQYTKVLFLDSDILCTGSAKALFELEEMLSAVPDFRYYRGFYRHPETYSFIEAGKVKDDFKNLLVEKLFNTGVMLINQKKLPHQCFENMIALVNMHSFVKIKTGHTDTVILNKLFLKEVHWLDLKYNFYVPLVQENDAPVFVHFIGKNKPWNEANTLENKWVKKWRQYAR